MPSTPDIVPFSDTDTDADGAARLLAAREARLRGPLASPAWTGLGFVGPRVRLERVIDARVAWAGGA